MKKYFISGPYSHGYIIIANSEEEAIYKCCCDYEWTIYDSWASDWDDYFCSESDFKSLPEEEYIKEYDGYALDLINYNWKNCYWGTKIFAKEIKI